MIILARFIPKNVQVEIEDTYESAGIKYACVRALEGQPFVGGNNWPVATAYATVPASDLEPIEDYQKPEQPNLLSLALEQKKAAWWSGESVWLVGGPRKGAFLKNLSGFIFLFVVGCDKGLPVFHYDPKMNGWRECELVRVNYPAWAEKAQQAIKHGIGAKAK